MEITEIKNQLSILEVLRHYHLSPDKNNRLKCPFHDDKTPSFQVYPKTGTWTCFSGNCTAGSGDQIEFIMKQDGISKHQAILKAKKMLGYNNKPSLTPKQAPELPTLNLQQSQKILTEAFTHFVRSLNARPKKAMEYLKARKLDYKMLSVGYDAGTLHKGKEITDKLKLQYLKAGLLKPDKFGRENSFYTRFNGCIIFPLLNKEGNIASLYGRRTEQGHHYLGGEHKGLYPGYPDLVTEKLILTEAIIDAATLDQLPKITKDFTTLALFGTNGFTKEHTEAVSQLKDLKEVILFFDGDQGGKEAVNDIADKLKQINRNIKISVVGTPEEEDINSLLQGHDPEIFTHLLEHRKAFSFYSQGREIASLSSTEPSIKNQNLKKSIEKEKSQMSIPEDPGTENKLRVTTDYMRYETGQLQITLWGGIETHTVSRLRATLHIQLKGNNYVSFRDTVDLYSNSQTDRLIKQAAEKLEVSTLIITQAIAGLTGELEQYRQTKREEKRQSEKEREVKSKDRFSSKHLHQAREFLRSSDLTRLTYDLFNNLGMIGQGDSATLLFFIFLTRLFKNPLHAIVMGSSGSGKTHLLQGVARTIPKQHINVTTSLSENTLYYTPKDFLKHKILLQEDLDGAYSALLPLRELMSNQEISRFSTKTNSRTGDSKQIYLHVEGPVCVAGATTKDRVYEDNANRSFLLQIEENPRHEAQVLEYQGRIAAGLVNVKQYEKNIDLLKACQLLLEPMEVVIPFAPKLQLPPHVFKKMRTKNHYLTLVKAITLWNQKQRKRTTGRDGTTCLVSSIEDVRWANILSRENLLRKSDELGGKTRNFFESLKTFLKDNRQNDPVFYAKDIRKYFRLHPMQLKRFLDELEGRGFIKCRSRHMKSGNEYEIITWDDYQQLEAGVDALDMILKELENGKINNAKVL